jgi:hypothetical protein
MLFYPTDGGSQNRYVAIPPHRPLVTALLRGSPVSIPIYITLKITDNVSQQYKIRDEIIIYFNGSIPGYLSSPIKTAIFVHYLINTET